MGRHRLRPSAPAQRLQNLARLAELKGLTQTQLAKASGLGTAYVNHLMTGRKTSPSLDALERLASALEVSSSVLIDRRLSDAELRTELSQGALRAALAAGISHPKFPRFVGTDEAPVTVDGWRQLARILEIADRPASTRASLSTRPEGSVRKSNRSP